MSKLNQTQKDFLKTVANHKLSKRLKKQFKTVNTESIELNKTQKIFLKTIDSEIIKNQFVFLFRKANQN
jgi:hypothetical protein